MADIPHAEDPFRHAEWRTYTPADGLPGLMVSQVSQDIDGFLWVTAAHGGVSRFDGEEFRSYGRRDGIPSDRVTCLLKDSRERLWFAGNQGGISWYDGRQFHAVEPFEHSRGFIQCMTEDRQGRIWFWGAGALAYRDEDEACDLLPAYEQQFGAGWRYCWGMAHDQSGNVWLGGTRLVRFDGHDFQGCGPEMGLPDQDYPFVVGEDAQGEIWFAGGGRIMRLDGDVFEALPGEYPGIARCICADDEGRLWISPAEGGEPGLYCVMDDEVSRIEVGGDGAAIAVDVFQDREGLLWFSTWGGGISRCDPHSIERYPSPSRSGAVGLRFDRRGRLWMKTGDGIGWLSGGSLEEWRDSDLRLGRAMCADQQGQLWCGGEDGLARWDEAREQMVPAPEREQYLRVTAICVDEQGQLVFGHDSARGDELCVTRMADGTYQELLRVPKGYPESCFTRILLSHRGHLWLALGGWFGLAGGEGGVGRLEDDGQVVWLGCEDGLVDSGVEDLCEDREGRLWIATRGGISCLDGEGFTSFTEEDGLPASGVQCVCPDQQGNLWFGAEACVVRYDGDRLQTIRSASIQGAVRSIVQDPDASLWLGTSTGLVRYVPTEVSPKVRVLRVIADRTQEGTDAVEVPVSSGQVIFEFKGLSLRTPVRDLLYTHRLSGLESDWQPASRQRQVAYPELAPGEYVFSVKAIDRDLNESEPVSVQVNAVPDARVQGLAEALGSAATDDFIGDSPALRRVQVQLTEVARTDLTVLILGETGTGKGLAARTVHAASPRQSGPFIQINCGALPEALVESELFGHEKGAFTGAHARKLGRVELAQEGTLFLDEIGDMSLDAQVKLLRLLEEGTFERVGGGQTRETDVRVIAATNRNLEQLVQDGQFRADLFYCLQVFPVRLPPLRERREDIELLALYFAERMAAHLGKQITGLTHGALAALRAYDWPGNVRELEHAVQRAVVICRDAVVGAGDISLELGGTDPQVPARRLTPEEYEREYIRSLLEEADWVIAGPQGAAARWGVPESSLRYRMKKLGIAKP